MLVEVSVLIDAPKDDVFAILTDYGQEVRRRINPALKSQVVLSREGDTVLCENEWARDGKVLRQQRRYHLFPTNRIEEEVVGSTEGMIGVITRLDDEGDQTRLTMESTYEFRGVWRVLGRFIVDRLRQADEELLETLKTGIEAEFEEVDDD